MHIVSAIRLLRQRDGGRMKLGVTPRGSGAAPIMVACLVAENQKGLID